MYPRSAAFDQAIRLSQTVVSKVDVLDNGVPIASDLPILGGSVTVDATANIHRRGALTVADATGVLVPNDPADLLAPYGREVRIFRGLMVKGKPEYIAVATLRISKAESSERGIYVTAADRSRSISRARFEAPYIVPAGTNYGTAIRQLLESRLSGVETRFAGTNRATPLLVFDQSTDPWSAAQSMAKALGYSLLFDPYGVAVLEPIPDPSTQEPVWYYDEGPLSMLLDAVNVLDDEPGYNGIVVDAEPTATVPFHSVVYDTNTSSPTYAAGPYGKVPRFYRSPLITTQAQADSAAAAMLIRERGGSEQVRIATIPHPAHETGDLVHIRADDQGINDNYLLGSFLVPLSADGTFDATTHMRRTL